MSVNLSNLFTNPILKLGDSAISISSIVTIIAASLAVIFICRLVSEWLKKWLLAKLGFERGTAVAIATCFFYLATCLGLVIVLQATGINLNSLSFLAGGLGIGLGLGLQELAKNFISGLTLLIEQPLKVGDFIQVDELSGTIEKISLRSTTIRTNDGISVIVPNLIFITNKIVNWSHQDPNSRIHIYVRIDYETDPALVTEILLKAAYMDSRILCEPEPQVRLASFGENAVNYELLVWINQPKLEDHIKSSLNFLIDHELRHRQINIPRPQLDLWWRNPESFKNPARKASQSKLNQDIINLENSPIPLKKSYSQLALRDLLKQVDYFENFNSLEIRQLIELGQRQTFQSEEIIFREQETGDSFYIILFGSVEVFSEKANKYLGKLYAGDFFGELALLMGIARSATVKALEETTLFVIRRSALQKLLLAYPALAEQIAQKLAERQQELDERKKMLTKLGLLERVDLDQNPLIWIRQQLKTLFSI